MALCNKYSLKSLRKPRSDTAQEIVSNDNVEIGIDSRIQPYAKIQRNRPYLSVHYKERKEVTLVEFGITNLGLLDQVGLNC